MRTQTRRLIVGVLSVLLGLMVAAYFNFRAVIDYRNTTKFSADIKFARGQESNLTDESAKTSEPPPPVKPSESSPPSPSVIPAPELKKNWNFNITDQWFSERSRKPYFITEINNHIEVFESNARNRSKKVGEGVRNAGDIILKFYSTLDEVDGTLKLELSDDGKSMTGRYTALDDPTKEAAVRLIRSAL